MKHQIPNDIFGAWIATKEQILKVNRKVHQHNQEKLNRITQDAAHHLVVPMLTNSSLSGEKSYRCKLLLKVANRNTRISLLMDFSRQEIESLYRPTERELHGIISSITELHYPIHLDDYYAVKSWTSRH
jgi:hypothetical protein